MVQTIHQLAFWKDLTVRFHNTRQSEVSGDIAGGAQPDLAFLVANMFKSSAQMAQSKRLARNVGMQSDSHHQGLSL